MKHCRFLTNVARRATVGIFSAVLALMALPASAARSTDDSSAAYWVSLGQRYEHGEGFERDLAKAEELYCAAAHANNADGFIRLGWMYMNGRGVPRDPATAHSLFKRAAQLGHDMGDRLADLVPAAGPDQPPACLSRAGSPTLGADIAAKAKPQQAGDVGGAAAVGPLEQHAPKSATQEQRRLMRTMLAMAGQFRLDPRLVLAVMQTESNFDPLARSSKNAQGLMQLLPETAERFNVRDIADPLENMRGGMAYLRWLLAYFKGDVALALAGYNAGEGAVDRYRGIPPYAETMAYVQKIRAQYPFDRHPYDAKLAGAGQNWRGTRLAKDTQDLIRR